MPNFNTDSNKYHGSNCKKCGNTLRYKSNNNCIKCAKKQSRNWKQVNREKVNASQRYWYKHNHKRERARIKKQRRSLANRKRAHDYNVKSEFYNFKAICEHYDNRCLRCGKKTKLTIDHIVPLSSGGDDIASNIQPLCQACNSTKGISNTDYRPDAGPLRWVQKKLFG